jgi:hypothetical protein
MIHQKPIERKYWVHCYAGCKAQKGKLLKIPVVIDCPGQKKDPKWRKLPHPISALNQLAGD